MSLVSSNAHEPIATDYLKTVGVKINDDQELELSTEPTTSTFGEQFSKHYDDYAKQGIVPGAINSGGDPSILESVFGSEDLNTISVRTVFAQALASYWSQVAITPGEPAHGGNAVIDVVNDASAQVNNFETAITNILTDEDTRPYFKNLIDAIEQVVKNDITWTVTEMMSNGSPSTFQASIT